MVAVTFAYVDGTTVSADLPEGHNLMEAALAAGIEGIEADCGGALSCATCHVQLDSEWREKLPPASPDESDMLEFAVDPTEASRLSCQIKLGSALDGMLVHVPASQR